MGDVPGPTNTQFPVAVHVLTYLAGVAGDHAVSSDELAESAGVNAVHIRRVLGPLREAGIVSSRPGAQGGWGLVRPARSIRLDEVWIAVNGPERVLPVHGPAPNCPVGRAMVDVLSALEADAVESVRRTLHRRTVADVLAESGVPQPLPARAG
jgi:Rrf2 family protein